MFSGWSQIRDDWLKRTSIPESIAKWAIDAISYEVDAFSEKTEKETTSNSSTENRLSKENELRDLKRKIRTGLTAQENTLDDISLNAANSYKLQLSVPSNLNYLMKAWAAAEGRDLSSVALQCLEIGLREMKSSGSIPSAAIHRYDISCEKRIALAEANQIWERYERSSNVNLL